CVGLDSTSVYLPSTTTVLPVDSSTVLSNSPGGIIYVASAARKIIVNKTAYVWGIVNFFLVRLSVFLSNSVLIFIKLDMFFLLLVFLSSYTIINSPSNQ